MTTRANALASRLIRHHVRVIRNTARVEHEIAREVIDTLEAQLVTTVAEIRPTEPARLGDRLNRAERAAFEASPKVGAAMRKAAKVVEKRATEIAIVDSIAVARLITQAGIAVKPAPDRVIERIARETVLEGAGASEWWEQQAVDVRRMFSREVRRGLREGDNLSALVKRIEGKRGAQGGILNTRRRKDAEALVRTSTQSIVNGSRKEMFRRSADVLQGMQWMTAFDSKVCLICAGLSGALVDQDGNSLPGSPYKGKVPNGGHPPAHFNCRCVLIPWLDDEDPADDVRYEDWLAEQPASVQLEVLGRRRYEAWKAGEITSFAALIDQKGRPLPVSALLEEDAA